MDKTVLVTGSAKGIGRSAALKFAKNGYTVILNTKTSVNELEKTLNEVRSFSPKSMAFKADVSDYDKAKEMIDEIYSHTGKIDVAYLT